RITEVLREDNAQIAPELRLIGSRAFALDYSPLVINEVDYNQSEYNKSAQFVEFKNTTTRSLSLAGYALELYDTANLPVDFEHPKMTLNLSADVTLEPGGYYVICRSQAVSSLSSAECDRFAPNDMVILPWDGPRGGLRLVFGEGENMEVVDSLSWGQYVEGLTEGTTPAPLDKTTKADYALSRVPDGLDTGENGFDFKWICASPRRANLTEGECACLQMSCGQGYACNPETLRCELVIVESDVIEDTGSSDTSTGEDTSVPPADAAGDGGDDLIPADSGPLPDIERDHGNVPDVPGVDTTVVREILVIQDLPNYGDNQTADNGGCSSGPGFPATGAPYGLLLLLFAAAAIFIGRRRVQ
ncbi:MAG TPA: lamin tail domain-containing protein, partial [Myxococcota bacterium]|nr:lamin tail domain-containing protein [Myxococcota bacterium]